MRTKVVLRISIPGKRVDMTGVWIRIPSKNREQAHWRDRRLSVCKLTDPPACYCLASGVDIELAVVVSASIPI